MKKRLLCALLTLCMILVLLPTTALAGDETIKIAGQTITDGYWVINNTSSGEYLVSPESTPTDHYIYYNAEEYKLTLKNMGINGGSGTGDTDSGIYSGGALTIHLIGENSVTKNNGGTYRNAIYSGGALTITADSGASLSATAEGGSDGNYGISTKQGLTINGGTVNATGGSGRGDVFNFGIYLGGGDCAISNAEVTATAASSILSYGIFCSVGKITVSNATVTATGGASENSSGISAKSYLTITGSTVTAKGGGGGNTENSNGIVCGAMEIADSTVEATGGAATAMSCGIYINNTYTGTGSTNFCSSITGASTVTATAGTVSETGKSYGINMSKSGDTISFTSASLTSGGSSNDNSLVSAHGETAAFQYNNDECLWPLQDTTLNAIFNDNNKLKLQGVNVKAKTAGTEVDTGDTDVKYTTPAFFSFREDYECVVLDNKYKNKSEGPISEVAKDICIAPVRDVETSLSPAREYGSPITVTADDFSAPTGATIVSIADADVTNAGTLFVSEQAPALSSGSISYTPKSNISEVPLYTTASYLVGFDTSTPHDTTPEYYAFLTIGVKTEANLSAVSVSNLTDGHRTYNGTESVYTAIPNWDGNTYPQPALDTSEMTHYIYTWQKKAATGISYENIANNAAPKDAGDYRLVVAVDESNPYFTGSRNIDFTIDKATITVTAANKSATVGDAAPTLFSADCTVTGLANGETLQTAPTVAYVSTPDMTKAGTTAIKASGAVAPVGGNYEEIVYVDGTLTVSVRSSGDSGGGSSTAPTGTTVTNTDGSKTTTTETTKTDGTKVTTAATVNPDSTKETVTNTEKKQSDGSIVKTETTVTTDASGKTTGAAATVITDSKTGAVTVPSDVISSLSKTEDSTLTVSTPNASIELDHAALEALTATGGTTPALTITPVPFSKLPAKAQENLTEVTTFSFDVNGGGVSFGSGTVTVSLDYTRKADDTVVTVYFVDDDGSMTRMPGASFANGKVAYKTNHFSLYAIEEEKMPFTDVNVNGYYADAVLWALDKSVTGGKTAATFAPAAACTRAQAVTFLWRAMGSPAPTATVNPFTDVSADAYYYKAILWALEKGVTGGTSATAFSPDAVCSRGQIVTFQYRAAGSPAVTGKSAFTDVPAGAYFADAVNWAVAQGVTSGMNGTAFAPKDHCTRGQIVTFLFRQLSK
jgi:hypothetical protein